MTHFIASLFPHYQACSVFVKLINRFLAFGLRQFQFTCRSRKAWLFAKVLPVSLLFWKNFFQQRNAFWRGRVTDIGRLPKRTSGRCKAVLIAERTRVTDHLVTNVRPTVCVVQTPCWSKVWLLQMMWPFQPQQNMSHLLFLPNEAVCERRLNLFKEYHSSKPQRNEGNFYRNLFWTYVYWSGFLHLTQDPNTPPGVFLALPEAKLGGWRTL